MIDTYSMVVLKCYNFSPFETENSYKINKFNTLDAIVYVISCTKNNVSRILVHVKTMHEK